MMLDPVLCDVDATCDPYIARICDVVKEAFQIRRTPWPSNQPRMQPDTHHFRAILAFATQELEGLYQIG
jgi:hypothetical protein